jgi:hypothetical protein
LKNALGPVLDLYPAIPEFEDADRSDRRSALASNVTQGS